MLRAITSGSSEDQERTREWAGRRRWTALEEGVKSSTKDDRVSERRTAMTGVVCELVLTMLEQSRENGEIVAVTALATEVSKVIGEEFERELAGRDNGRKAPSTSGASF